MLLTALAPVSILNPQSYQHQYQLSSKNWTSWYGCASHQTILFISQQYGTCG